MAERTADVQAHWTRPGVLARIDAALAELGQDPQILTPEILATVEHLHSGGLATTREQAKRIALTKDSRVLDVGCGIGGPARYLAHTYGCRVEGDQIHVVALDPRRNHLNAAHMPLVAGPALGPSFGAKRKCAGRAFARCCM